MATNGKINILMVDDQPAKLLSYEAILSDLGENLIRAGSAREALQQLLQNDVAVVLMDVCMPEMDGYELAELIRNHPRCQQTAIILVSAIYMTDFDRLKGYDRGAVDYLPVPVVPEILRAKVAVFADLYRKTHQLHQLNRELEQRVAERTLELKRSEQNLSDFFDNAAVGLHWADPDGVILRANQAELALLGYSAQEYVGRHISEFHADTSKAAEVLDRLARGETLTDFEACLKCRDGSLKHVLIDSNALWENDEIIHTRCFTRDITDRKRSEEERRQLLESERAARAEAERAGRVKDEFLATLSHELRTPLSAILVWAHLLQRGKRDPATLAEGLKNIEECARAQNRLVEDLLDMSRIISGKFQLDLRAVQPDSLIAAAIEMVRPAAQAKRIEIRHAPDPYVGAIRGDEQRLKQVFWNLLSNAIKFSPSESEVRVSLRCDDTQVEVRVSDDGQGIKPDFLPFVFDRFRQADSSLTRRHEGMGLGLALVKHLVELHGGAVSAESPGEGRGATFAVRLPLAATTIQTKERAPQDMLAEGVALSGVRVLVVDDDPSTCELVKRVLIEYQAEVRIETSATAALASFESFVPDVLVSDIGMPEKDGYEFIREVRRMDSPANSVPAVALTAFSRPEDRARSLEAGFNMHVAKPVDPYELLLVVEALARGRGD